MLYDSTASADIPSSAEAVAGYANGQFAWSRADWDRWSHVPTLSIDVLNEGVGNVLDVEQGDATPADAPAWLAGARKRGIALPTIYCNLATFSSVISEFLRQGVPQGAYWIADWTGGAHQVSPPASAVQFADPASSGGHYDTSVVFDLRILRPPAALLTPPPGPQWLVNYLPVGTPTPAPWSAVVTIGVDAPTAEAAMATIPPGSTLVGVHGPF